MAVGCFNRLFQNVPSARDCIRAAAILSVGTIAASLAIPSLGNFILCEVMQPMINSLIGSGFNTLTSCEGLVSEAESVRRLAP